MAAEERVLELEAFLCGDPGVSERPEACRHPVDRTIAFEHDLDAPAGSAHSLARLLAHHHPRPLPGDSDDGSRIEVLYVEFRDGHRTLHRQGRSVVRVRERLAVGAEGLYLVARAAIHCYLAQDPADEAGELESVPGAAEERDLGYPGHGA